MRVKRKQNPTTSPRLGHLTDEGDSNEGTTAQGRPAVKRCSLIILPPHSDSLTPPDQKREKRRRNWWPADKTDSQLREEDGCVVGEGLRQN